MYPRNHVTWDFNEPDQAGLARYVLEDFYQIYEIAKKAESDLSKITPWLDPSFDAYISGNKDRIIAQAKALFKRLQKHSPQPPATNLTYVPEPFEPFNNQNNKQSIRLASEVLTYGEGCCIDWALLFAACLLNRQLRPIIIVTYGFSGKHALVGYWLTDSNTCKMPTVLDSNHVISLVELGKIRVINPTCIPVDQSGMRVSYKIAETQAMTHLPNRNPEQKILFGLDVYTARKNGILPLTQLTPFAGNHPLLPARDFQDRPELAVVHDWWMDRDRASVLALIGIGGSGKTAIAQRFLTELNKGKVLESMLERCPLVRPDACFVWSFYEKPDMSQLFPKLYEYIMMQPPPEECTDETIFTALSNWQGLSLFIVFDGLEVLQSGNTDHQRHGDVDEPIGRIKPEHRQMATFLRRACENPGPLRILVTSKLPLTDISHWLLQGYQEINVGDMPETSALRLLSVRGIKGTLKQLSNLLTDFGQHALTIDLLGNALSTFCGGDSDRYKEIIDLETMRGEAKVHEESWRLQRIITFYEKNMSKAELLTLQRVCMFRGRSVKSSLMNVIFGTTAEDTYNKEKEPTTDTNHNLDLLQKYYRLIDKDYISGSDIYKIHPLVARSFLKLHSVDPSAILYPMARYLSLNTSNYNIPRDEDGYLVWDAFANITEEAFKSTLIELVGSEDRCVQAAAAVSLVNVGDEEAVYLILSKQPRTVLEDERVPHLFFQCAFQLAERHYTERMLPLLLLHLDPTVTLTYEIKCPFRHSDLPYDVRHFAKISIEKCGQRVEADSIKILKMESSTLVQLSYLYLLKATGDIGNALFESSRLKDLVCRLRYHTLCAIYDIGEEQALTYTLNDLPEKLLMDIELGMVYSEFSKIACMMYWRDGIIPQITRPSFAITMADTYKSTIGITKTISWPTDLKTVVADSSAFRKNRMSYKPWKFESSEFRIDSLIPITFFPINISEPDNDCCCSVAFVCLLDTDVIFKIIIVNPSIDLNSMAGKKSMIPEIVDNLYHQIRSRPHKIGKYEGISTFTAVYSPFNIILSFVTEIEKGIQIGFCFYANIHSFGFPGRIFKDGPSPNMSIESEIFDSVPFRKHYSAFEELIASFCYH